MKKKNDVKVLLSNKRNERFYEVFNQYECGLVLDSTTARKILNYQVSLNGSYGWIKNDELWLRGLVKQDIKLLLHREEINKIIRAVREKKYLLIPSSLYLKNYRIKVLLLTVKRGKYTTKEKLETIKRKDEKKLRKYEY